MIMSMSESRECKMRRWDELTLNCLFWYVYKRAFDTWYIRINCPMIYVYLFQENWKIHIKDIELGKK